MGFMEDFESSEAYCDWFDPVSKREPFPQLLDQEEISQKREVSVLRRILRWKRSCAK